MPQHVSVSFQRTRARTLPTSRVHLAATLALPCKPASRPSESPPRLLKPSCAPVVEGQGIHHVGKALIAQVLGGDVGGLRWTQQWQCRAGHSNGNAEHDGRVEGYLSRDADLPQPVPWDRAAAHRRRPTASRGSVRKRCGTTASSLQQCAEAAPTCMLRRQRAHDAAQLSSHNQQP